MSKFNKAPVDLTEEVSMRRFLNKDLSVTKTSSQISHQEQQQKLYQLPTVQDTELEALISSRVQEFESDFNKLIAKVESDLAALIPTYTTIVETITDSLTVADGDLKSSIDTTAVAAVDADGRWAYNTRVLALETNVADNYATTTVIAGTYATQTEVGAIYGVTVEANGHVSGYKSIATGLDSVFQIYAEKFAVSSSATEEGYQPFQIDTVAHKINFTGDVAIDGNLVVSGTITAGAIAINTITASQIAANTITAGELAVIGISTFTNDSGYTDDTVANTKTLPSEVAAAVNNNVTTIDGGKITAATIATDRLLVTGVSQFTNDSGYTDDTVANTKTLPSEVAAAVNNNVTTIDGGKITAATIAAAQITASTITADKMNIATLSSLSADIGTITAGTINADVVNAGVLNLAQIPPTSFEGIYVSTTSNSESTAAGGYDFLWTIQADYTASLVVGRYLKFEYAMNITSVDVTADIRFGVLMRRSGFSYSIPSSVDQFFQVHKGVVSGDVLTGSFYLDVSAADDYGIALYMFNEGTATLATTYATGSSIIMTQTYK